MKEHGFLFEELQLHDSNLLLLEKNRDELFMELRVNLTCAVEELMNREYDEFVRMEVRFFGVKNFSLKDQLLDNEYVFHHDPEVLKDVVNLDIMDFKILDKSVVKAFFLQYRDSSFELPESRREVDNSTLQFEYSSFRVEKVESTD